MKTKSKLNTLCLALVVMLISILVYYNYDCLGESFENTRQQIVKITQRSSANHIITRIRNLAISSGDVLGSESVICNNLSCQSISHMRAVSAQWQHIKNNVTCHFYSAFWETRMPLQEVRVIGMSHLDLMADDIWCQLWYEGQGHPLTVKAIKLHICTKCTT